MIEETDMLVTLTLNFYGTRNWEKSVQVTSMISNAHVVDDAPYFRLQYKHDVPNLMAFITNDA